MSPLLTLAFGIGARGVKFKVYLLLLVLAILPAMGGPISYDPVYHWIQYPGKRDPELHLAFVEIVAVADEQYTFTNAANSKVSDDGGRTWYTLLKVRSGIVTLNVVESPGVEMPHKLSVQFESFHYVPTRETLWTDQTVLPGKRMLGFFRKQGQNRWTLETSCFIDPVDYLLAPSPGGGNLQSFFTTELASKATVEARRKELGAAMQRAREHAATNTFDGK